MYTYMHVHVQMADVHASHVHVQTARVHAPHVHRAYHMYVHMHTCIYKQGCCLACEIFNDFILNGKNINKDLQRWT